MLGWLWSGLRFLLSHRLLSYGLSSFAIATALVVLIYGPDSEVSPQIWIATRATNASDSESNAMFFGLTNVFRSSFLSAVCSFGPSHRLVYCLVGDIGCIE